MSDKVGPYQVINIPEGRRLMMNMLRIGGPRQSMYGLLEVDVTEARRIIAAHKARSGEALSFTGFITYCLARAVGENPSLQSYLKGSKQFVQFDDVDVGLMVEHRAGDKRRLMGMVVRAANRKTFLEIHREIRAVQSAPAPVNRGMPGWFRRAMLLPKPLSSLFVKGIGMVMQRDPAVAVEMGGTVGVTAVGMFGEGHSGWGVFPISQVLGLIVGSVAWKPAVVDGRVEPREMLNLTVSFDHDVVDGAPAARFTHRLIALIESAAGLADLPPAGAGDGEPVAAATA